MSPRKKSPRTPTRAFLTLLWRQALFAIPFAVFFMLIFGGARETFMAYFKISLVFSYSIGLSLWAHETFVIPRLFAGEGKSFETSALHQGLSYVVVSMTAAAVATFIINRWVAPGAMGSLRGIVVMLVFALLFSVLFLGVSFAFVFYRRSLDKARTEEELNVARRIQRGFLLSQFPEMPGIEVFATNVSSRQVSGDFYDVVPSGDNAYLLAIADVSGKGVPAALLTSMLQASLRTQANAALPVARILENINHMVCGSDAAGQFATFFLARIEQDTLRLTFSNAGHNYPVVFRTSGEREFLVRGGVVVGFLPDAGFEEESVQLKSGDRLVFYTDGVTEAARADGEMFGEERLYQLVAGLPPQLDARAAAQGILDGVRAFLDGVEAGDDITVMVVRVLDRPAASA